MMRGVSKRIGGIKFSCLSPEEIRKMSATKVITADTYDDDVRLTVDAIVGLIEPVIIIVMGVFVGFLVLAILLPILTMSTNIRGY